MVGRLAWLVVVGGAVACARRESGVEPTLAVRYAYRDRGSPVEGQQVFETLKDKDPVLVGLPIQVHGYYAATCSYTNTASLTHDSGGDPDKYPRHWGDCDREKTDVAISCDGPCTVRGPYVTPTAPGDLHVTITLTSRDAPRKVTYPRTYRAVAPEEFELGCGATKPSPTTTPDAVTACTTWYPTFQVSVVAGPETFSAPLLVNGEPVVAERGSVPIELARMFGYPPSSPFLPAPGVYRLELRYGPLVRQVDVELLAEKPKPPTDQ